MHSLTRALRRTAPALALAAAVLATVSPHPVAAASYSGFYIDFSAQELMRLTNKDRVAYGKRKLKVDTYLAAIARDKAFTCPSNGKVYQGRSKDMATRDYLGHAIKGCRTSTGGAYTIQNLLRRAGYGTYTGENIGQNNWPDTGATYKYGCTIRWTYCNGRTTTTAPVATVQRMWMQSSGHRWNILNGNYDRFGCAAWDRSDGTKFFTCIFAKGGPKPIDTAAPRAGGVTDNAQALRPHDDLVLQASFSDSYRLSDGWVNVDGVRRRNWAYDYNVTSSTESLVIDPRTLSAGTHTIVWGIRDVAGHVTYRTDTFTISH